MTYIQCGETKHKHVLINKKFKIEMLLKNKRKTPNKTDRKREKMCAEMVVLYLIV